LLTATCSTAFDEFVNRPRCSWTLVRSAAAEIADETVYTRRRCQQTLASRTESDDYMSPATRPSCVIPELPYLDYAEPIKAAPTRRLQNTDTIRSSVKYPLRCERSQSHQLDDYGTEMMLPSGESQRNVSGRQPKALFTLANSATNCRQIFRRIRRQSPKTATVAEFGDGRRFGRQSPNSTSPFSVTVATIVASVDRA